MAALQRVPRAFITLELTAIAPGGEAVGRHDGLVVFVPHGLPGEHVQVELVERKRSYARGHIVAVLAPSPDRTDPACPAFGRCGGCDWQHIAYAAQVAAKTQIVREQLARIGKLPDAEVRQCVPSPIPLAYRNHVRLALTEDGRPGYRAARSQQVIPVSACPVVAAPVAEQLAQLAAAGVAPGAAEIELRAWRETVCVGGIDYRVSPGAFFQANTAVAEQLVAAVLHAAAPSPQSRILDLYCGVGLFTVPLALRAGQVVGVEANAAAATDAEFNLRAAGVASTILPVDVGEALCTAPVTATEWDIVVLDPPRTGVEAGAIQALQGLAAPRLVYVSCDPATLARDARLLCAAGYSLAFAQPFDMFPQTHHVEVLAQFDLTDC